MTAWCARVALLLALWLHAGLALADVEAGIAAYRSGEFEAALGEFQTAAETGDARAQYNLGLMHAFGQGVAQDHTKAAGLWQGAKGKAISRPQSEYVGDTLTCHLPLWFGWATPLRARGLRYVRRTKRARVRSCPRASRRRRSRTVRETATASNDPPPGPPYPISCIVWRVLRQILRCRAGAR